MPAAILGIAALATGAFAGSAAAESRNRGLERIVAKSMYSAGESAQLHRAFSAARRAGVDERDALALVEAGVSGEFDASQSLRLLSLATQLALANLPVESFVSKVEEGVSKRVDADRVVQAAEQRALTLNNAKQIINSLVLQGVEVDDRDELLPDLAAALEAGRKPDDAREILVDAVRSGASSGAIRRKLFP